MSRADFHLSKEMREELKKIKIFNNCAFEFDKGWYEIIYDLGMKIVSFCDHQNIKYPHIQQIKEKFGTLRFYYCWQEDVVQEYKDIVKDWVLEAERLSELTCESCGASGQLLVSDGIWAVTCNTHRKSNSLTVDEFKTQRDIEARARRKCSICGINNADIFFDGLELKPYCDNHKNNFITHDEYFENRFKIKETNK